MLMQAETEFWATDHIVVRMHQLGWFSDTQLEQWQH